MFDDFSPACQWQPSIEPRLRFDVCALTLCALQIVFTITIMTGGSMLESTGSHGRGVERRVPEMRRTVEFNCTSP